MGKTEFEKTHQICSQEGIKEKPRPRTNQEQRSSRRTLSSFRKSEFRIRFSTLWSGNWRQNKKLLHSSGRPSPSLSLKFSPWRFRLVNLSCDSNRSRTNSRLKWGNLTTIRSPRRKRKMKKVRISPFRNKLPFPLKWSSSNRLKARLNR